MIGRRVGLALVFVLLAATAEAGHAVGHCRPAEAPAAFPADFPLLLDAEWGFRLGGWGGGERSRPPGRRPVIFVHGNGRDASDWDEPRQSVRARFRAAGYREQGLWALSYNGRRGEPLTACRTDNARNVPDLAAFLDAVLAYTGAGRVDVVAHSLGVTLTRATLKAHPALAGRVGAFVAIAGANHGTPLCVGLARLHVGCDELMPDSPFLRVLNGGAGGGEAPPGIRTLVVASADGSDAFYPGAWSSSPHLNGARMLLLPRVGHDGLRVSEAAVAGYLAFLQGDDGGMRDR
jgi:pimeloyl-ACP methyl ester carboxylesterase